MQTFSRVLLVGFFVGITLLVAYPANSSPPLQDSFGTAEALNPDANVRSEPSTAGGDATIIGQIQPGELHPVYGRYFEWVLIEFTSSPNDRAWVFNGVVRLSVPLDNLPNIDPASIPSVESILTATALFQPTDPAATPLPTRIAPTPQVSLPTFTPVAMTPTPILISDLDAQPSLDDLDAERERRLDAITQLYSQDIVLVYGDQMILLPLATINFVVDREATAAQLDLSQPFRGASSIVVADYDETLLRAFLENIAQRYDRGRAMDFNATQSTFTPGAMGTKLDIEDANARIISAMFSPFAISRTVYLPVVPNAEPEMDDLRAAIVDYTGRLGVFYNSSTTAMSVFVHNLETDATMGLQEHVLHSATSTGKIGIIANYFRYLYQSPSQDALFSMIAAVVCSSNIDANRLMDATGNGDDLAGIRNVTVTFCQAGATNTRLDRHFGIGPAGEGGVPADYYTPAGAPVCEAQQPLDTSLSFPVDTENYTTAADMGNFLTEIYTCAMDGSGLANAFPGEITQQECTAMLEILSGTNFSHMMELGVPEGVEISHKVGYAEQAVGDAGIVFSPNADYVLTMYMWDERLGNFDSFALGRWAVLGQVSRIVYNFFNTDVPLTQLRTPLSPLGGAACVMPSSASAVNINDVDAGRFDASGIPLSSACYDWPDNCRPFDNWGN